MSTVVDELVREQRGLIMVLRINRPASRNSLTPAVVAGIGLAMAEAEEDPGTRVVVLTGTGDKAFSSGMDLGAFAAGSLDGDSDEGMRAFARLTEGAIRVPVIGAANGTAVAGGFELLLGCDLVVASAEAKFGLPEARRGLIAGGGGTLLSARIPLAVALEFSLTGDLVEAERARALGLVNRVVPPDEVLDAAVALAERVARNGPLALRASKEIGWTAAVDLLRARALVAQWQTTILSSEDAKEGARAFMEKRDPVWKGR